MQEQREISSLLVVAVVVAVTLLWQPAASEPLTCGSPSLCFFYCGDSMLDLTPLARGDQQPMFRDQIDSLGQNRFSFSPCSSFSEGSGCFNTSVCQVLDLLDTNNTIDVGSTQSMTLSKDTKATNAVLTYTHTQDGHNRSTVVTLVCANETQTNNTGSLHIKGETPAGSGRYVMTLTSQYACFQVSNVTTEAPQTTTSAAHNSTAPVPGTSEGSTGDVTSTVTVTPTSSNPASSTPTSHASASRSSLLMMVWVAAAAAAKTILTRC